MESSRITTSFFNSTRRLARSITISATCTWRAAGSSKVDAMISPLTVRCISVTSSGRSSTSSTIRCTSGLLAVMACAMCCIITVLPLLGGATISARWPRPMGAMMSMMRPVMFSSLLMSRSSRMCSLGNSGVRFSDFTFDHVAGVQVETTHLAGTDVDIVRAGGEARVGAAQEAETVGQNFQHAVGNDLFPGLRTLLDDRKHQFLLAHAAGVFDFEFFGLLEDFRHVKCLEFVEVHGVTPGRSGYESGGCSDCRSDCCLQPWLAWGSQAGNMRVGQRSG